MLSSLLALSILFIPFKLIEAAWRLPVVHTRAQYGLNRTSTGWLKSGTVRYNRRPQQPIHNKFSLKRSSFVSWLEGRLSVYGALKRGADVCIPQFCRCGERIYSRGLHGLSCEHSAGRFPMHSAMNDVIKRSLYKASLPSVLEHPELDRRDRSRPDCITVLPFICGRSLVWDYTCVDIFTGVHLNRSAIEAGISVNYAKEHKGRKYAALAEAHQFEPIAVETMGVYGGSTKVIMRANRPPSCWIVIWALGRQLVPSKPGNSCSSRQCVQYSLSRLGEELQGRGS